MGGVASKDRDGRPRVFSEQRTSRLQKLHEHRRGRSRIREAQILAGAGVETNAVVVLPDRIVTGDNAGTIRVFNKEFGELEREWAAHAGAITTVIEAGDGSCIVSGGEDAAIRVWDVETWRARLSLYADDSTTTALVAVGADRVCSGSCGVNLYLWDLQTGESSVIRRRDRGPVKQLLYIPHSNYVVTTVHSGMMFLYDSRKGYAKRVLVSTDHMQDLSHAAIVNESHMVSTAFDGSIVVWSISRLRCILALEHADRPSRFYDAGHIPCMFATIDDNHIAAAYDDSIAVYNVLEGTKLASLALPVNRALLDVTAHAGGAFLTTVSEDGSMFLIEAKETASTSSEDGNSRWSNDDAVVHESVPFSWSRWASSSLHAREGTRSSVSLKVVSRHCLHAQGNIRLYKVDESACISCGEDGVAVLWRLGAQAWELRNHAAANAMLAEWVGCAIANDMHDVMGTVRDRTISDSLLTSASEASSAEEAVVNILGTGGSRAGESRREWMLRRPSWGPDLRRKLHFPPPPAVGAPRAHEMRVANVRRASQHRLSRQMRHGRADDLLDDLSERDLDEDLLARPH